MNLQEIEKYLTLLGEELEKRQVIGEIILAGGAVMLLVLQSRLVTEDIDAYFLKRRWLSCSSMSLGISSRQGCNILSQNFLKARRCAQKESRMAKPDATTQRQRRKYHPKPASEAFRLVLQGDDPWIAIGNFLDDWRRLPKKDRLALVAEPIAEAGESQELQRWAAFFAAMVEQLCLSDGLPAPTWTAHPEYSLADPWYLYPGNNLVWRAWQEEASPAPFKMRNIFGGDRILDRV